jgi:ABC-2 type transport system ATP-binding protein
MNTLLHLQNLTKVYGDTRALQGVNLTVEEGKIIGLLGPNGSGKTTLIKILAGILTIDGGAAYICGNPIGVKTKSFVSYLPDKSFLCEWMSVEKMLNYTKDFFPDFRLERAMEMVQMLGINPKSRIKTLSKGTKEKVSLIIAMSRDAKLYLLDEPIAGVDPAARDYVIRTIINNYSPNSTVIISTHLISDVEQILSDFVFISNGQIVMSGGVEETRIREQKSIDQLFREVFRC